VDTAFAGPNVTRRVAHPHLHLHHERPDAIHRARRLLRGRSGQRLKLTVALVYRYETIPSSIIAGSSFVVSGYGLPAFQRPGVGHRQRGHERNPNRDFYELPPQFQFCLWYLRDMLLRRVDYFGGNGREPCKWNPRVSLRGPYSSIALRPYEYRHRGHWAVLDRRDDAE